ncbi:hypothetical protein C5167_031843 [Papaver somniferum]|uniref:Uncharacterized protein n=1 Tax=Papaver somniferum TaxID=3469 RepID=A0A4Y7K869_PAPSO|nr:hypothetical protein C5167_031843 [Papaver somniferum]
MEVKKRERVVYIDSREIKEARKWGVAVSAIDSARETKSKCATGVGWMYCVQYCKNGGVNSDA